MNKRLRLVWRCALFLMPILYFLYNIIYTKLGLVGTFWNLKIGLILLLSLPLSAIWFLFQKEKHYKVYGVVVCVYILYVLYDFLEQTSGAS